jgi:hypothetical protein
MTRTPLIVIAGLAVALILIALVADALKGPSTANEGTRAVIVPTSDRSRAVVVPPCNTGAQITPRDAPREMHTIGSTVIALPQAPGTRLVLVPRCSKMNGVGTSGTVNLPSAAFVLKVGTRITAGKGSAAKAVSPSNVHSQLVVPSGSSAGTIVVPPCSLRSGSGKGAAVVVSPPAAGSETSLAPPC